MCDIDPLELHDSASEDEKETQLVKSFNNLTPPSSNDSLISSSSKGLRQPEAVVGFCIKCKTKKATLHVRQTSYCQPCFLETHQSKLQHQLRKLWKPTLLFTPSSSSSSGSLKKMKETWSTDTRSWSSSPSFHPTMGLEATKKYNEGDEDEAIERKARFPLPSKVVVHVQDTLASWVLIQGLLQSYPWEKEAWCRLKSHSTTSSSSSASSSFLVTFVYIHAPEVGPLDSEGSTSSHEPMGGGAFNVGQFHRWFSSSRVQQTKNPSLTTAAPFSSMVQFLAIPLAHVLQLTTVRKWMKTVFCNNQLVSLLPSLHTHEPLHSMDENVVEEKECRECSQALHAILRCIQQGTVKASLMEALRLHVLLHVTQSNQAILMVHDHVLALASKCLKATLTARGHALPDAVAETQFFPLYQVHVVRPLAHFTLKELALYNYFDRKAKGDTPWCPRTYFHPTTTTTTTTTTSWSLSTSSKKTLFDQTDTFLMHLENEASQKGGVITTLYRTALKVGSNTSTSSIHALCQVCLLGKSNTTSNASQETHHDMDDHERLLQVVCEYCQQWIRSIS